MGAAERPEVGRCLKREHAGAEKVSHLESTLIFLPYGCLFVAQDW